MVLQMAGPIVREVEGHLVLEVVVAPGAARTEVRGEDPWRRALRIRVAAPARAGEANAELVRFLAERLRVPPSSVRIVSGARSNRKRVVLLDVPRDAVERALGTWRT